jgi:hypothetical protein
MKVRVRGGNCLDFGGDALLLFHHSDVRPLTGTLALLDWRCNAAVSRLWKRKEDLLRFGQLTILATQGKVRAGTAILTGLGPMEAIDADLRHEALRLAVVAALGVGAKDVAVDGAALRGDGGEDVKEDLRRVLGSVKTGGNFSVALFLPDIKGRGVLRNGTDVEKGAS